MAKDGQVYFHRGPFADPVKQQRCTTEPVRPLGGINKEVCGAKLHPTTVWPILWIVTVGVTYWTHTAVV